MEATYKPEFKEWKEGKITAQCTLTGENGEAVDKFLVKGAFNSREEADKYMREFCINRGYTLKN